MNKKGIVKINDLPQILLQVSQQTENKEVKVLCWLAYKMIGEEMCSNPDREELNEALDRVIFEALEENRRT